MSLSSLWWNLRPEHQNQRVLFPSFAQQSKQEGLQQGLKQGGHVKAFEIAKKFTSHGN
ncbi:MAG: hypothetical protein AB2990_00880 [Candidatus Symbiodolus clandestinus]